MKLSLAVKTNLTIVGLVVIGGISAGYLVYTRSTSSLKDSISSSQSLLTRQSMDKIDRYLYERLVDIQSLNGRQQLQSYLTQPATRNAALTAKLVKQLNDFRILGGAWEDMSLLNTSGTPVLTTDEPNLIKDLSEQQEFKDAFHKALGGEASYSDVFTEQGENQPTMLFMTPIRDTANEDQPLIGVIVGELAWQSTLEILRSLQNIEAELLNASGINIGGNSSTNRNKIFRENHSKTTIFQKAQSSGQGVQVLPGIEDGDNGANFVTSYVKESGYLDYRGNGWTLILRTPVSKAFAPVQTLTKELVFTFLGILLLSVMVFFLFFNQQILRPLAQLLSGVKRLSTGDFSRRLELKTGDEFGELALAFNDMADKLQFAYSSLNEATQKAQKERNILQTILDNLPVGVFVAKAPSGEQILINKVGAQMRSQGLPHQNGQTLSDVEICRDDGSPYPEEELPLFITLKTGRSIMKDDIRIKRADGGMLALRTMSTPLNDVKGKLDSVVVVFEDTTKELELEHTREEFFSIASHELRTPLTAIRGNTSIIQDYYENELKDPTLKEMISDIHESSVRLIDIVNDFLDTSRLEQKRMKFTFESFNLVDVAESVVKEFQVTGSRRKILLEVTKPDTPLPLVTADVNRTKQILINLIGNALKFTDEGSITISFAVEGSMVKTFVKDTGRGMDAEAQQRLFKKFEQSGKDVMTRDSVRGTGLGLYISKLISEQMHGTIRLESSAEGVGTTFSFTLPATPPSAM